MQSFSIPAFAFILLSIVYLCSCQKTTVRPYKFGFSVNEQQHRQEQRDEHGIVMGEFGFITADGIYHVTVYATDEEGRFRILAMKNYPYTEQPKTIEMTIVPKQQKPTPKSIPLPKTAPAEIPRKKYYTDSCSSCSLGPKKNEPPIPATPQAKTPRAEIRPLSRPLDNPVVMTMLKTAVNGIQRTISDSLEMANSATITTLHTQPRAAIQTQTPTHTPTAIIHKTPTQYLNKNLTPNQFSSSKVTQNQATQLHNNINEQPITHTTHANVVSKEPVHLESTNKKLIASTGSLKSTSPLAVITSHKPPTTKLALSPVKSTNPTIQTNPAIQQQQHKSLPDTDPISSSSNIILNSKSPKTQVSSPAPRVTSSLGVKPGSPFKPNSVANNVGKTSPFAPKPKTPNTIASSFGKSANLPSTTVGQRKDIPTLTAARPSTPSSAGGGFSAERRDKTLTNIDDSGDLYRFKYTLDYNGHKETGSRNGNKVGTFYSIGDDNIERTIEYIANENGYQPRIRWRKLDANEASRAKENALKEYEFVWFNDKLNAL